MKKEKKKSRGSQNTREQVISEIKERIRTEGVLTCIDVEETFLKYRIPRGNLCWKSPSNPSVIYWSGLSAEGLTILYAIARDKSIKISRTTTKPYLCQGARLNLSDTLKIDGERCKIWQPVCFTPNPSVLSAV